MSTKTNFKRIALVAVAALGLGVLSSVPSSATIIGTTLTTVTGTATKAKSDSTTAATATIKWQSTVVADTVVVSLAMKSTPNGLAGTSPRFYFGDTSTSMTATPTSLVEDNGNDSATAVTLTSSSTAGYASVTLKLQLDSQTARAVGTYTITVNATPFSNGNVGTAVTQDVTITVAALDSEATAASSATSTAYLTTTASNSSATQDEAPSVLATVSSTNTPRAYIYVNLKNASSAAASESVTITTTVGTVGTSAAAGKSVVVAYTSAGDYNVYSDGTAGTATITVKTASVTFATKTVVFYASVPTSITATVAKSVPGVGTTSSVLSAVAKDANGNIWGGALKLYSDTLATISDTGTACTYVSSISAHLCSVTGVTAGTAKIMLRNDTLAVKSNEVSLTVSSDSAASIKLAFDKASYAPGEKATLTLSVLSSGGKAVPEAAFANLLASGGISLSVAAGNGSDTTTSALVNTTSPAALGTGTSTEASARYVVYMPSSGGTITASATGGTSLPLAGQVKVSATATVTDSGAAALAAVTALATTVASLKTLITTLTNLVLKIQKKVKA